MTPGMTATTLVGFVSFLGAVFLAVVAAKSVVPGRAIATLVTASLCHVPPPSTSLERYDRLIPSVALRITPSL